MSSTTSMLFGVAAIVFLLVGPILLIFARKWQSAVDASRGWPTATGRVVSAEVKQKLSKVGSQLQPEYVPVIVYDYSVAGQVYRGNVVHVGISPAYSYLRTERDAQAYIDKYPVGAEVAVAYNPADPASALLEPGGGARQGTVVRWCAVAVTAIGAGAAVGWLVARLA